MNLAALKASHYTTGEKFKWIMASGLLVPAEAGTHLNERPAVWFSAHQCFEPTALKPLIRPDGSIRMITLAKLREHAEGLCRFGAESAQLLQGAALRKALRMSRSTWLSLEAVGLKRRANPRDWLGNVGEIAIGAMVIERMGADMAWTKDLQP